MADPQLLQSLPFGPPEGAAPACWLYGYQQVHLAQLDTERILAPHEASQLRFFQDRLKDRNSQSSAKSIGGFFKRVVDPGCLDRIKQVRAVCSDVLQRLLPQLTSLEASDRFIPATCVFFASPMDSGTHAP